MIKSIHFSRIATISIISIMSLNLIAQNTVGYGPRAKSLAGAGLANIENSLWANFNPGGLVFLGQKIGVGIEISSANKTYEVFGEPTVFEESSSAQWPIGMEPGRVEADNQMDFIPNIGFNWAFNENNSLALSIYGNGNRGASYNVKTYYSNVIEGFGSAQGFINPMGVVSSPTFMNLSQYFAAISYSRKLGEKLGVGISVVGAWQSLSNGGLEAFGSLSNYSAFPHHVSTNEVENVYGLGAKIGVQWQVSEKFNFAFAYRSKLFMSRFESYKGFISESGKLDIPAELNIGILYHPFNRLTLMLDVNRYCYQQVPAWGLTMMQNQKITLGGDLGGGFGRINQMSYKFGLQYKIPKWQFRAGYAHTDQVVMITEVALNLLIPEITTDFISFGFTRDIGEQKLSFAVVKGFNNSVLGINILDKAQQIELTTDTWAIEVAVEF